MNIEDRIRSVRYFHKSLPIHLGVFKERVLMAEKEYPRVAIQQRKERLVLKKTIQLTVSVVAVAGLFGFTAAKLKWFDVNLTMGSTSGDISTLITPLESWTNTIQQWHIKNPMTLQEARSRASYPILEPAQILDWTLVQSFGFRTQVSMTYGNGSTTHTSGAVQFLDFWTGANGQKIVVQQHPSSFGPMASNTTVGFPAGSYQIDSFKPDLAVMMNLEKGRMELAVFHIDKGKKVSELDFYGTTSPGTLESFAKDYLNAPTN